MYARFQSAHYDEASELAAKSVKSNPEASDITRKSICLDA